MGISLQKLLIIPLVLQVVGVTTLVGYLSYRNGQDALHNLSAQLMQEVSDRTAQNLAFSTQLPRFVNQTNAQLMQAGRLDGFDLPTLKPHFVQQLHSYPTLSTVALANEAGEFLSIERPNAESLIIRRLDAANPERSFDQYQADQDGQNLVLQETRQNYDPRRDPPDDPWYTAAQGQDAGVWRLVVSLSQGKAHPLLHLVHFLPVKDAAGTLQGVTASSIYLTHLGEFLQNLEMSSQGQVFLLEPNGNLIATSTGEVPFVTMASDNLAANSMAPPRRRLATQSQDPVTRAVAEALLGQPLLGQPLLGQIGALRPIQQPQSMTLQIDRQRYYVRVAPGGSELNWLIVVVVPEADFMATVYANLYRTLALCGLVLLASISVGRWIARRIARPIIALNQATQSFALGHGFSAPPPTHIQEVESLRQRVSQMVGCIEEVLQGLQKQEQTLSTLLEGVPVGVSVYDATGQLTLMNKLGKEILGEEDPLAWISSSVVPCRIYQTGTDRPYPPENLPWVQGLQGNALCLDDLDIEVAGRRVPLEVHTLPIVAETGEVRYVLHAFWDITERRRAEVLQAHHQQELERQVAEQTVASRLQEALLKEAQRVARVGSWEWDVATGQSTWSDELFSMLGLDPAQGVPENRNLLDFVAVEGREEILAAFERAIAQGTPYEVEHTLTRADGSMGYVISRGTAIRDDSGRVIKVTGTAIDISDRKQIEISLRQSEARYLSILDEQTELVTRFRPDGTLLFVNDAFCRYYKLSKEQLIGYPYYPRIYPEDQPAIDRCLAALSPQHPRGTVEHRVIVTGEVRWMQWVNQAIYDHQGQLVEFQSVGRDIHDRKQAEMALQTTTQQLQAFLENAPTPISLFTREGQYLRVNLAFAQQLGMPVAQILGRTFSDFFPASVVQLFQMRIQRLLETGQPLEVEDEVWIDDKPKVFQSILFPAQTEDQQTQTIWAIANDITDRKQAERILRESEAKFSMLFHANPSPAWITSIPEGRFMEVNKGFSQFYGLAASEIVGQSCATLEMWTSEQDVAAFLQALETTGRLENFEVNLRIHSGELRTVLMAASINQVNGQACVIGVLNDISDRKQAELQLQESEARQRAVLSIIPDVLHIVSADGVLLNQVTQRPELDRLPADADRIGRSLFEIEPPAKAAESFQALRQALATQTTQRYEQCLEIDGRVQYEEVECVPMEGDRVLFVARDITARKQIELELQRLNQQLRQLSNTDSLTQLANRRQWQETLEQEWSRCQRQQQPLAIIMLDIDYFKPYNDRYGHPAGDVCLQRVAHALQACVSRPGDLVARYGGEEFCLLLPDTDELGATTIAQRIQEELAALAIANEDSLVAKVLTVSMGIVIVRSMTGLGTLVCSPEWAIATADAALYRAKRVRNRYCIDVLDADCLETRRLD